MQQQEGRENFFRSPQERVQRIQEVHEGNRQAAQLPGQGLSHRMSGRTPFQPVNKTQFNNGVTAVQLPEQYGGGYGFRGLAPGMTDKMKAVGMRNHLQNENSANVPSSPAEGYMMYEMNKGLGNSYDNRGAYRQGSNELYRHLMESDGQLAPPPQTPPSPPVGSDLWKYDQAFSNNMGINDGRNVMPSAYDQEEIEQNRQGQKEFEANQAALGQGAPALQNSTPFWSSARDFEQVNPMAFQGQSGFGNYLQNYNQMNNDANAIIMQFLQSLFGQQANLSGQPSTTPRG